MFEIKNKKPYKVLISLIMILIIVSLGTVLNINKEKSYSINLIDIIDKDKEYNLSKENLELYEKEVKKEIESGLKDKKDELKVKRGYYALGAIKYLKGENKESIKYLEESLKYNKFGKRLDESYELDVKIYSALSSNYIQLDKIKDSEIYFEEAKATALNNSKKHLLCELYYGKSKAMLNAGENINISIDLMRKALEYTDVDTHRVRNYLYLSTLYKLVNEFDLALEYTINALEIAMKLNDNVLINSCVINLGENYYVQKNYSKTIEIYESFLKSNRLKNINNTLTVYGYLAECYGINGDYANYQIYKEKYIQLANKENSIKNLIWIYSSCADIEINHSKHELAKEYLDISQRLYENNKNDAYANTDIALETVKNKINYYENKDYKSAMENYNYILDKLKSREIESDITDSIIDEILKISFEKEDYDTFTKFIKYIDSKSSNEADQAYTDSIFTGVNNLLREKEMRRAKIRVTILMITSIISIGALFNSSRQHKKVKSLNKKLKELNNIDSLTKVYNKGCLNEKLKDICENKEEICFVMIDIDYFKLYNDNYGHIKGDEALIEVAQIIKSVFKDDLVFRYGGEEFSVISYKSINEVIKSLEELREVIFNKNIIHEYSEISDRITLSIGLASSKLLTEENLVELTKKADENLYISKQKGRNRYTF